MHPPDPVDPTGASAANVPWQVEGPLVIATVADWHRRLVRPLQTGAIAAIDLSAVSAIDVFGLQLLLAASRTVAAAGRKLTLLNPPPAFAELCRAAGFAPTLFSAP